MNYENMSRKQRWYWRKKGYDIPKLSAGAPKGYKQSKDHIQKRKRFGKDHPNWKAETISVKSGRTRALRMYPDIGMCVICKTKKAERHHIDGNTANNKADNILAVCRKCHMREDGRLDKFKKLAIANQPKAVAARWSKTLLR